MLECTAVMTLLFDLYFFLPVDVPVASTTICVQHIRSSWWFERRYITKANEQRLHITQTITAAIKVKDDCAVVNKERGHQYKYKMEDEVVKLKVS